MSFQLTVDPDTVIRLYDNTSIPRHHRYWVEYEEWVENGGIPIPAKEQSDVVKERTWRDSQFSNVKWLRERHRDEADLDVTSTLTDEQFKDLLNYMQALRKWPQNASFPQVLQRPTIPLWINEIALQTKGQQSVQEAAG